MHSSNFVKFLIGFTCVLSAWTASAVDLTQAARTKVVILRNGFVLRGQVTSLRDYFLITQENDDQIRMPASRVEMICDDLEEAYLRKRDLILPHDARAHADLADWCLRHDLPSRAADQILALHAEDSSHIRLSSLMAQLERTAGGATRSAESQLTTGASDAKELSIDLRHFPAGLGKTFTNQIQPFFLNRCATGACHGSSSSSGFQLSRPPNGLYVSQRLTQRNLQATLEQVDLNAPTQSKLLQVLKLPHGPVKSAILSEAEAEYYTMLANWLQEISKVERPTTANVRDPRSLGQRFVRRPMTSDDKQVAYEDPFDPQVFNERFHGSPND